MVAEPLSADRLARRASRHLPRVNPSALAPAVAALAVAWAVYCFTGAQAAFLLAMVVAGGTIAWLCALRSVFAVAYLVALVALVGPEANGAIGRGSAPAGTLRLLDWCVAVAVVTIVALERPRLGAALRLARCRWRELVPALVVAGLIAYALLLWWLAGAPLDGLVKTDVRLIALSAGTAAVVWHCRAGGFPNLVLALCGIGAAAAVKAVAIALSGLWVIGTYDRLQATRVDDGASARVILIGGDTLMTLVPAIVLVAFPRAGRGARRFLLACAGAACAGLLVSGTRTSLLVALLLAAVVAATRIQLRRPGLGTVAAMAAAVVVLAGFAVSMGVVDRLTQADAPGVGVNFRKDEISRFFQLPAGTLVAGRGLGGAWAGEDSRGLLVRSGWLHELPLWIVLKVGFVGLAAAVALGVWLLRRFRAGLRDGADPYMVAVGGVVAAGVLVAAFAVNRAALPEGAVILTLGIALIVTGSRRVAR
jgi:hypothetical protein